MTTELHTRGGVGGELDKREGADDKLRGRAEKYFDVAADVRKFEIGLVWQRSLFFWGFIGAAFVAYADLGGKEHSDHTAQIVVACFGFVCSIAWTLLNRGSKYWQEAWETKTERKEQEVLSDILFARDEPVQPKFFALRARRFSVSKLLIALSDFTAIVWLLLLLQLLPWDFSRWPARVLYAIPFRHSFVAFTFTIAYAIYMMIACRSSPRAGTKLGKLIGQLSAHVSRRKRKGFLIFGSSAITMRGVNLSRSVNDLDIFVSEETFDALRTQFDVQFKSASEGGNVEFYAPERDIEILKSFPGVTFDEVRKKAAPIPGSNGFPVASLDDLTRWKAKQNREKDLKDIEAIKLHRQGAGK